MYYSQEEWSLPPLELDEADHEGDGGEARSSVSSSLEEAHSRSLPYSRRKVRYLKRQPSWREQAAEDGRNFAARPSREAFLQARHDFEAKRRDSLLDSEEQESGASSSSSSSSRKEGEEGIWLKGGRTVEEEEEEGDGEDECWWHWTRAAALPPAKPIWLDISMPENAGREAPNLSSTSTTTRPPRAAPRRHPSTSSSSSSSFSLSASPKNTGTPAKEEREPTPLQPPSDADAETDDANERRHAAFLRASYAAQYRASRLPPPAPVDPGGPDGRPDAAHDWHREDFSHWWRNDGSDSDSDPGTVVRLPVGRGRRLER